MASDWSIFTDLGSWYAKIQKNVKSWSFDQSVWIWPVSSWFELVFGLLTTHFLWCENWICLEKTLFRANEWSCEFHRLDFILKHWTALCNRPASISILTSQIGQSNLFTTHGNSVLRYINFVGWHWVILTYPILSIFETYLWRSKPIFDKSTLETSMIGIIYLFMTRLLRILLPKRQ